MVELDKAHQEDLAKFKETSRQSYQSSFFNSLSLFNFNKMLEVITASDEEKKKIRDDVFSTWSKQIIAATSPIFAALNQELNKPQNRWQSIIEGNTASVEDYSQVATQAIKEIKDQFYCIK